MRAARSFSISASCAVRVPSSEAPAAAADSGYHRGCVRDRSKRHEEHARFITLADRLSDGDGQPRLSDATRTAQGHHPDVARVQHGDDRVDVVIATDQGSGRDRQRAIGTARRIGRYLGSSLTDREARETLAQQQCQIIAHKPPQLSRRAESAVGLPTPLADLVDHRGQLRLPLWRRCLDVQQSGARLREAEFILEAGDVHIRPDPAVALPVHPDEDVGLGEVCAVQLLRWVWARAEFEHHGRQTHGRDRPRHHPALLRQFGQRRADEHPQTLIRGSNDRLGVIRG